MILFKDTPKTNNFFPTRKEKYKSLLSFFLCKKMFDVNSFKNKKNKQTEKYYFVFVCKKQKGKDNN